MNHQSNTTADGDNRVPLLSSTNGNKGNGTTSIDDDDAHVVVNLEDIEEVSLNKESEAVKATPEKPKKKKKKVIVEETTDN